MPLVHNTVHHPIDGTPAEDAKVTISLIAALVGVGPGYQGEAGRTIQGYSKTETDALGLWSATLVANADLTPEDTVYEVEERIPGHPPIRHDIEVPEAAATTLTGQHVLPAATITVASSTEFEAATVDAPRWANVGGQLVRYTGKGAGTLTGVSGGTGTIANGAVVEQAFWVGYILTDPPATLPTLHILDPIGAHASSAVSTPAFGGLVGTTVAAQLAELDTEKVGLAGTETITGLKTFEAAVRFKSGKPWIDGFAYASLQAAIDAITTRVDFETFAVVRVLLFDDFDITAPLTASRGMLRLEGANEGVRIRNTTSGSDVLQLNPAGTNVATGVAVRNLTLLGTGTASRAIYANALAHFCIEEINTVNHQGPSLYMESTNVGLYGCAFGKVSGLLAQPSQAVAAVTDNGGTNNVYEMARVREAEVGIDLVNAINCDIRSSRIEANNRGSIQTGIRARTTDAGAAYVGPRTLTIRAPYLEANPLFAVDADGGYIVTIEGGENAGGVNSGTGAWKERIRLDGGGSLKGFNGHAGTYVSSDYGRIVVEQSHGVIGRVDQVQFRDRMPPLDMTARNSASKSWLDTEPTTWFGNGTNPPTLAYDTTVGFLGSRSEKITFPGGGAGAAFARAYLTTARLNGLSAGVPLHGLIAVKASRAGERVRIRHVGLGGGASDGNSTNFVTDTEWQIVGVHTARTAGGDMGLALEMYADPSTDVDLWIGAVASSTSSAAAFINTEQAALTPGRIVTRDTIPSLAGIIGTSIGLLEGSADTALAANTAYFLRVTVPATFAPNRIRVYVANSSGNIDAGIYADSGTGLTPGTKIVSLGLTPCPAIGRTLLTIPTTTLVPGVYWIAFVADNGTATFTFPDSRTGRLYAMRSQTLGFPLPATATVNGLADSGPSVAIETA